MFPRLPRLLRLALLVLCLSLSLLLVLRAGGDHSRTSSPQGLLPRHASVRESPQASLQSAVRHSQSPAPLPKLTAAKVFRHSASAGTSGKGGDLKDKAATEEASAAEVKTTEPPRVNPHHFAYLINPREACSGGDGGRRRRAGLLVYVHSAPANLKKRMSIRQTWGERGVLQRYNASLVFIMGTVSDPLLMDLLQRESETFGDIVQEDFLDSYRNLTYKAIAGLKWAATFCPSATYILKTDDDILVNLPRVVRYLRTTVEPQYGAARLILCNQWVRMKIIRDAKSKWYIPESDLKGDYFSTYCSGSAFLLSGDMARLLYEASLDTPFFWVDDFYITGTLVQRLKIKHRSLNKAYSLNPGVAEGKFTNDTRRELFFFHLHKLRSMYGMWRKMAVDGRLTTNTTTTTSTSTRVASTPDPAPRGNHSQRAESVLPVARATG